MSGKKILRLILLPFIIIILYIVYIVYMYKLVGDTFNGVEGYNYSTNIDYYSMILIGILAFFPSIFIFSKFNQNKPSGIIIVLIYLIHIIPSIIFYGFFKVDIDSFIDISWPFFISSSFSIFVLMYFMLDKFYIKIPKFKGVTFSEKTYNIFIAFLSILTITYIWYKFGSLKYISIFHVYETRKLYKETVDLLSGYIIINSGYILSPFLVLYAFTQRFLTRIFFLISGVFLSMLIFSNTGFKSVALMWIYVFLIFIYLKKIKIRYLPIQFLLFFIILIISINIIGQILNLDFIYLHWIRRLLLSAGMNTTYFYDYIITHNLSYLKNAPFVVSLNYFGTEGSANTGFIGDGMSRYFYVGIWFNYLILFFALKLLDSLYVSLKQINSKIVLLSLTFPISYAVSYSRTTSIFITYGLILLLFLFYWRKNVYNENLSHNYSSSNF